MYIEIRVSGSTIYIVVYEPTVNTATGNITLSGTCEAGSVLTRAPAASSEDVDDASYLPTFRICRCLCVSVWVHVAVRQWIYGGENAFALTLHCYNEACF